MEATKICRKCGATKPTGEFPPDVRHRDGLGSHCHACRRRYHDNPRRFTKRTGERRRPRETQSIERRARRRIQTEIDAGLRPHPNAIPCVDCDGMPVDGDKDTKHEYDHVRGYEPPNDVIVEVRCVRCHREATEKRRRATFVGGYPF